MTNLRTLTAVLATACGCIAAVPATAAPYSDVYVFGDSLSDIGRVLALTGGFYPAPPAYALGRFSNGPVAVEAMTFALTGAPLTLGHDFAYGGARTGTSPFDQSDSDNALINGTGLQTQTAAFRAAVGSGNADPNALYVVWAGINDFADASVLNNAGGTQWGRVTGNIETAIGNLAADGARHFFVPDVPNRGLTPGLLATGPANAGMVSAQIAAYDATLIQDLTAFDAANAGIDIRTFDVYGFMTNVIGQVEANGSHLGFTNATSQCLGNPACTADPSTFFFFDSTHPTAAAHALLGNAFAAAAVPEPQTQALLLAGIVLLAGRAACRRVR